MATTVREILERKPDVYAVRPEDTVHHALQVMAEKNIGAVLVMSGDEISGVFSERDYARRAVLHGDTLRDPAVRSLMTADIVSIEPTTTVDACMSLMTDRRIRHLPVVEEGRVIGVVSIGDIVRAVVEEQQFTIRSLEHYVTS
jgi:CBS domain-containing protein